MKKVIVLFGIVMLLCLSGCSKKINPEQVLTVEYTNQFEGIADAKITYDFSPIMKNLGEKKIKSGLVKLIKKNKVATQMIKAQGITVEQYIEAQSSFLGIDDDILDSLISCTAENTRGLHNGDEIIVKFEPALFSLIPIDGLSLNDILGCFGLSMPEEYKIKVSGLTTGNDIHLSLENPEQYISFTGVEGHGQVQFAPPMDNYVVEDEFNVVPVNNQEWKVVVNHKEIGRFTYQLIVDENVDGKALKEGDKISIGIQYDYNLTKYLMDKGYAPSSSDTHEIVVPELGKYIDNFKDFTKEDYLSLEEQATELAKQKYDGLTLVNSYSAELDPSKTTIHESGNAFAIQFIDKDEIYYNMYLYDIYRIDGKLNSDTYSFSRVGRMDDANAELSIRNDLEGYAVTKVNGYELPTPPAPPVDPVVPGDKTELGKVKVVYTQVRMRTGPGTNYDQLQISGDKKVFDNNEILTVYDMAYDSEGYAWYQTYKAFGGYEYEVWIRSDFVEVLN